MANLFMMVSNSITSPSPNQKASLLPLVSLVNLGQLLECCPLLAWLVHLCQLLECHPSHIEESQRNCRVGAFTEGPGKLSALQTPIRQKLTELGVERLILPAVSSVLHTWTRSFGFSVMTEAEKLQFLGCTFLDFQGTRMCHKLLVTGLLSIEPSISRGNTYDAIIGLDRISAVSEVSQAERIKKSGIIARSSSEHNGGKTPLEILVNQPIDIERRSETSPREGKNNVNTGFLKCYQRRKFAPMRVEASLQK